MTTTHLDGARRLPSLLLWLLVGLCWIGWFYRQQDLDDRTTAELEFDAWAQREGLSVTARTCLEDRTRADGRVPCAALFTEVAACDLFAYCIPKRATVWCAGDGAKKGGCVWP